METVQYLKKHPMAALEVVTLLVIALCGLYVSIADLFFKAQGEENHFIILTFGAS
jgi:hypothetical protein